MSLIENSAWSDHGDRRGADGMYECVCGATSKHRRDVGFSHNVSNRHAEVCRYSRSNLINTRVLIIFEPIYGFTSADDGIFGITDTTGVCGYDERLSKTIRMANLNYLDVVPVRYSNVIEMNEHLARLALQYADYETFFIFTGHADSTGRLVVNGLTDEWETAPGLIFSVISFYKSQIVEHARVMCIYFAFCQSALTLGSVGQTPVPSRALKNTILVCNPSSLPALELYAQDAMWIIRSLRSTNWIGWITRYIEGTRRIAGLPSRLSFLPPDGVVDGVVDRDIRTMPAVKQEYRDILEYRDMDGESSIPLSDHILGQTCSADGMPKQ